MLSRLMQRLVCDSRLRTSIQLPRIDTTTNCLRPISSDFQVDTLRVELGPDRRICSIALGEMRLMKSLVGD
jgi:hypothetical protein